MRAGAGAAVGGVAKSVDVHSPLGVGGVVVNLPRNIDGSAGLPLNERDCATEFSVTTDDSD